MLTRFDLENAEQFANYGALKTKYQQLLRDYPYIFKHVKIDSRQATNQDYYIPSSIASECIVYSLSFDEVGCRKIGCFSKKQNLQDCTVNDDTQYIRIGEHFSLACQPACHEISNSLDTEFRNDKCLQVNINKKLFALFPESSSDIQIYQPIHTGLNFVNGDIYINKNYCSAFGLDFENNNCISYTGQDIGEFILGSTVFKLIKKGIQFKKNGATAPAIPNDIINLQTWLEGSPQKKRTKRAVENDSNNHLLVTDLIKEYAIDLSIDYSFDYMVSTLKKRIPNALTNLSKQVVNKQIFSSSLKNVIVQNQLLGLAKLSTNVLGAFAKMTNVMGIFSITSLILDVFDPFHFNRVIDKKTVDYINKSFDYSFFKSNKKNVEITPEKIWLILEQDISDYMQIRDEMISYYLQAVIKEDVQERNKIQMYIQQNKNIIKKKTYNFNKIIHIFLASILIILSILFIKYIAYFILLFFILVLYYQPDFY